MQVRGMAGGKRHARFGGVFVKRGGPEDAAHSIITGNPQKDSLPVIRAPVKATFNKRQAKVRFACDQHFRRRASK